MANSSKTSKDPTANIAALKKRIREMEKAEAGRKQMEELLRQSEERYRRIFENSIAGIYQVTPDGRYRTVNPSFAAMFGYGSPAEMVDTVTNVGEQLYIHPEDRKRRMAVMETSHGIVKDYQVQLKRKDGSLFWVSTNARMVRDTQEGLSTIEGTCMDITERKKADEALQDSEERHRTIIEALPDAVLLRTKDQKIIYANPAALKLFRANHPEEVIGRSYLDLVHPDDRALSAERIQLNFAENKVAPLREHRLLTLDGQVVLVESTGLSVKYRGETQVFGIFRDITERKHAEEKKRSLEERLQRSEKMEALGLLAGGVAHDLNNVMGIVIGYAELILGSTDASSPIKPHLENIINGGMQAAAIVSDLLTLARRGVFGQDVINLNKTVADCLKSPEFEKLRSYHPAVTITTDIDPDLLNISGSSVHFGKALYNLISNACEAMEKGGDVTIKTANQYLDRPIQGYDRIQRGDYVLLSVADTGEGIHEDDLKRIFEPFYTRKVMGRSGTGLGLSVVWGTVKDHHGYINVQSERGKGSTFTLYFPVTREEVTADVAAAAVSEHMGRGESILVVDDVKEQRDLAACMLRTLNYDVACASCGEDAVAHIKEHQVDLMVLDMIMDPGMDGLDTYKRVLEIRPKQKAIIMSGFSESERVHATQGLGAGAYLRKPYIKEKLGMAVRKELDRK